MSARLRRCLLLTALAIVVVACEAGSQQDIRDLLKKWNDNDLTTITHALLGTSTGNAGQDGLIDSAGRMDEQDSATRRAREAQTDGDIAALDGLITKFPGDYGLRLMRGALALQQGDTSSFVSDYTSVTDTGQIAKLNNKIVELRLIRTSVEGSWKSVNQCDEYYGTLSQLHRQRFEISHRQSDLDEAANYDSIHTSTCSVLPR